MESHPLAARHARSNQVVFGFLSEDFHPVREPEGHPREEEAIHPVAHDFRFHDLFTQTGVISKLDELPHRVRPELQRGKAIYQEVGSHHGARQPRPTQHDEPLVRISEVALVGTELVCVHHAWRGEVGTAIRGTNLPTCTKHHSCLHSGQSLVTSIWRYSDTRESRRRKEIPPAIHLERP